MTRHAVALQLIFLAGLMVAFLPGDAQAARTKRYYRRVAQTLIDAENRISSAGRIYVGDKEVDELFVGEHLQGRVYVKSHFGSGKELLGTFKIITDAVIEPRMPPSIWKAAVLPGKRPSGRLWSRPVVVGNKKRHEFLARHVEGGNVFELTMMYDSAEKGRKDVAKLFADFVQNGHANGLFAEEKNIVLAGTWKGDMINSRGEKLQSSTLLLNESGQGEFSGVWHAGWKIENARRDGEVLTWQHSGIQEGCRSYSNRMEVQDDGQRAVLTYKVNDRCREPHSYEGRVNLRRDRS